MADEIKRSLVIDTGNSVETLGKLRREMASIVTQLEGVEEGSEAFVKLQNELKKTEAEVSKVEGAFGDATDKIKTLSGSGVERFNASIGLMKEGIQNLDLGKFKIGIQGATQAFGGLGKAIIATGIGALVAVIGYVIANFDELSKKGGILGKVLGMIGDYVKFVISTLETLADKLGLIDKDAEAQAAAQEERTKRFIKNEEEKKGAVEGRYSKEIALAKSLGKSTEELELKSLKAQKAVIDNQIQRIKAFQETSSLFDSVLGPILDKLKKDQEDAQFNIQIKENEILTKRNDNYQKFLNDRKKFLDKFTTETEFEKIDREEKEALKEAERLKVSEEEKLKIREFYSNKRTDLLLKETEIEFNELQKAEQKALDDLAKEADAELEANERARIAGEKYLSDLKSLADEEVRIEKEKQDKLAQAREDGRQLAINQAQQLGSALISIASSLSEFGKKSEKQKIKNQRNVTLAGIALSTGIGIAQAVSDGMKVGITPIEKGIAIAGGIALVLANIAKARQTVKQADEAIRKLGESTPPPPDLNVSAGGAGGSGGGSGFITPPVFNLGGQQIGGAGTLLGSGFGQNQQQPIKVFVSETDISAVQNKVQVTQGNSLFEGPQ